MTATRVKAVAIRSGDDKPLLSKAQKAFNLLIKKIETERARLAAWEVAIPSYQHKYSAEMLPLVEASEELQVSMVHCLDRASDRQGLTKSERRMLRRVIAELAGPLLDGRNDAGLKALYNRHSGSDYDADQAADNAEMKFMLEDVLGFELGDDFDISSPEDLLRRAEAQMKEQQAQDEADREAWAERQARRNKSASRFGRSTANWPAPCIPIANPTHRSASARPP